MALPYGEYLPLRTCRQLGTSRAPNDPACRAQQFRLAHPRPARVQAGRRPGARRPGPGGGPDKELPGGSSVVRCYPSPSSFSPFAGGLGYGPPPGRVSSTRRAPSFYFCFLLSFLPYSSSADGFTLSAFASFSMTSRDGQCRPISMRARYPRLIPAAFASPT